MWKIALLMICIRIKNLCLVRLVILTFAIWSMKKGRYVLRGLLCVVSVREITLSRMLISIFLNVGKAVPKIPIRLYQKMGRIMYVKFAILRREMRGKYIILLRF